MEAVLCLGIYLHILVKELGGVCTEQVYVIETRWVSKFKNGQSDLDDK